MTPPSEKERLWGLVRLVLGFAQVFGATLGFLLLIRTEVNTLSQAVIVLTSICTTVSVLLFGGRRS